MGNHNPYHSVSPTLELSSFSTSTISGTTASGGYNPVNHNNHVLEWFKDNWVMLNHNQVLEWFKDKDNWATLLMSLFATLVIGGFLAGAISFCIWAFAYFPRLPSCSVHSVSASVQNMSGNTITADLYASFVVENQEKQLLLYENMTAYALASQPGNHQILSTSTSYEPFELSHYDDTKLWFYMNNSSLEVDEWDDVVLDKKGNLMHGQSGFTYVNFELKGNVTYKGKDKVAAGVKLRIPMEASFRRVRIKFSSNSTQTVHFNESTDGLGSVSGQWDEVPDRYAFWGASLFWLAFGLGILFYIISSMFI